MKNIIGKILVILTLLKNVIIRKNKYTLHFKYKFDGFKRWFYDWDADHTFKWAFDENNLEIGIVESGSASVVHESLSGTRTILENLLEGDIFGALFYFYANRGNIFVEATKDCSVRFIDYDHLIKRCENACAHHSQLVNNVLIMI